jgi:hypothetical protein
MATEKTVIRDSKGRGGIEVTLDEMQHQMDWSFFV